MKNDIELIKNQNHPVWRYFDERFKKLENLLLSKKAVLNFNEAAEYAGFSKSFLYKMTSAGKIPHFKPSGKLLFFERKALDEWLLKNPVMTQEEIQDEANRYVTANKGGIK